MSPSPAAQGRPRGRWGSFVADTGGGASRALHEVGRPEHRVRVEHDGRTLLVHLSDEDGTGWTVLAVDRDSRRWAVAQDRRQVDAATHAYSELYGAAGP